MMKKLLSAVIGLLYFTASAQYTTPNSNVNWGLDDLIINAPSGVIALNDGVYTLSQNLTIAVSDTLTINENAILRIDPNVEITIAGTFFADADEIVITASADAQPFGTIRFEENSTGYLRNVTIDYGKGIRVATGDFEMQNCSMSYHQQGTTTSAALTFSTGRPLINASRFTHNFIPAFGSGANIESAPTFSNNYLENNNSVNNNRPQINMGPSGNDTIRIVNNIIKGNPLSTLVGGISASSLLGNMNKVVIEGNTITDNRYGITVAGANSSGYIRNNIIQDNNTQNIPAQGGSGISLNASGAATMNIIASGNQIRRNLWGITVIGQARLNLGDGTDDSPGGNVFAENGNGGNAYALFNNTPHAISAMNNCWIEGAAPTATDVENVISHQFDDALLGLVTYTPFSDCLLATNTFAADMTTIYPNPNAGRFNLNLSQDATLELYSMGGQRIWSKKITSGQHVVEYDAPTGVYVLRVTSDAGVLNYKMVRR